MVSNSKSGIPYFSVTDPGFPIGGCGPVGGVWTPMRVLFGENVCGNERIGSHREWCVTSTPPRSANAFDHKLVKTEGYNNYLIAMDQ